MRKQWKNLWRKGLLQAAAAIILALPVSGAAGAAHAADLQTLAEVYEIISNYHVSGIDSESLGDAAIEGMLGKLNDPYTRYIPPEESDSLTLSIEQQYVGIGIRVGEDDKGFFVEEVFPESPASEGGLKPRDYIVEVGGRSTEGWALEQLTGSIRGEAGTDVELKILRGNETFVVKLTRKAVEIPSVVGKWLGQGIGYLQLTSFSNEAANSFGAELDKLKNRGLTGLVLDLRGNPGGYVHVAQTIAGQFVERGVLMHTKDRYGEDNPVRILNGKKADFRVIILVDGNSASASEVLAGALQDHGVGRLVGTKTFGKGSVQSLVNLSNGGVLRVTVEEYLTPNFRKVDGVGLEPDREVQGQTPQLLAALHEAGIRELRLVGGRYSLEVNGATFNTPLDYRVIGGKVYAASRTLAALVDRDIRWNGSAGAVELVGDGAVVSFSLNSGELVLDKGTSYVEMEAFGKRFSGLRWSLNPGTEELTIEYTKGS